MTPWALYCPACRAPLLPDMLNRPGLSRCPACRARLAIDAYPALLEGFRPGQAARRIVTDDEAGCFYHPGKQAVVACDECGRFLCSLCDLEIGGRHICPQCVGAGEQARPGAVLDNQRFLYDTFALWMAVLPLVVSPLVSLFVTARRWGKPGSLVRRSRWRFAVAIPIALTQLALWGWLFFDVSTR